MSYKVTILGKSYDLPARTLSVDDGIETMSNLNEKYKSGEITRRETIEQMHEFVYELAPGAFPSVEEVDTNDLMKAVMDIITAYDAPARKARNEARLAEAKEILSRPEIEKLLKLADMKK